MVYSDNIHFSLEYAISIILVLIVCNYFTKLSPQTSSVIVVFIGLIVAYITLYILNMLFPAINKTGSNMYEYIVFNLLNTSNHTSYLQIWPPIFAVFVLFIILLYSRYLG